MERLRIMGASPLRSALIGACLLTGTTFVAPEVLWADVVNPSSAPVNTDSRPRNGRERREPDQPSAPGREDRIPVVEAKRYKILRGANLEITLDTVEDPVPQRVRFFIRDEPTAGFLSEIKDSVEDLSIALVTYHSDPSSTAAVDQLTFAAQYPLGRVSAPVAVVLDIVDPAPVVEAVPSLDFGRTVLGTESVRTIVLSNKGTAIFEHTPELAAPWRWVPAEGEAKLRIGPGDSIPATFAFAPDRLGESVFRLPLPTGIPSQPGVLFSGKGVVPFTLDSEHLTLSFDPASRQRTAKLSLTNPGLAGVAVTLITPDRLRSPTGTRIWLDKEERKEIPLLLAATDSAAFQGTVELECAGYRRTVEVSASATPGYLTISGSTIDPSLDFGRIIVGQEISLPLTLRNSGGEPVSATVTSPKAPFRVSGPNGEAAVALSIAPGQELVIETVLSPEVPSVLRERLVIAAPDQAFVVSLRAEAILKPADVEVTAAANLSGAIGISDPASRNQPPSPKSVGAPAGASKFDSDYRSAYRRQAATPASIGSEAGRREIAEEAPHSVTGRNGSIALPPMISLDGMLALSPYKLKTDVKLPQVPFFRVQETHPRRAILVWPKPQGAPPRFEVETRVAVFNPVKQRPECFWMPLKRVEYATTETAITAEISGLEPDSYHIFRVFTLGANGTNSLPSKELGARTLRAVVGTSTIINLGVGGMVLASAFAIYMMLRREKLL